MRVRQEGAGMPTAKLSRKAQLVLPASIRRRLNIRPGDRLILEVEGDHVVLRKAPESDVDALRRYRSDLWKDYTTELERERDGWDR